MASTPFPNHYQTLCVTTSATPEEIRRAYRVLARRYHPDVNPGKSSEEKFKAIASAYAVLSDPEQRTRYDAEFQMSFRNPRGGPVGAGFQGPNRATARQRYQETVERARKEAQARHRAAAQEVSRQGPGFSLPKFGAALGVIRGALGSLKGGKSSPQARRSPKPEGTTSSGSQKVSILEVSVTMRDAIRGVRKTVEISEPEGQRKISVAIPPGMKTGSVLRFRDKSGSGEEMVFILRVASHPFLFIENKGLVVEVPISVSEAVLGASLTLPTLDDPVVVKIPPGSQSGSEIRVRERGIATREGTRGDLFFRVMIRVPDAQNAVGFSDKVGEFEKYYASSVRNSFPKNLLEAE